MKILICDDEEIFVEEIVYFCKDYFAKNKIEVEVEGTTDAERIEANRADILILDIDMPRRNGIDIKNSLERQGNGPLIIFATNFGNLIKDAIGRNVIGFMEKPINSFQLSTLLNKAIELLPQNVMIEIDNGKYCFCDEIICITVEKIYTNIYLTNQRIITNVRKPIRHWEEELISYGFMRISESCIVNCNYIDDFSYNGVKLRNATNYISVSRRRRADCKEKYFDYCKRMAVYL